MMKLRLSRNGRNTANGTFDWTDAIADAAIVSGLTFFTALGGSAIFLEPSKAVISATISAGGQFFLFLALKRGLRKE